MTLTIGRGRGYVPAELNRGPETTIGVIPIDSIFSPVRRVAYEVEAARVGQRTDYDKLVLDVTTDGSIDAAGRDRPGRRDPDPPARDLHRPRRDRGLRRAPRPRRRPRRRPRTGWRTSRSRSSSSASARTTASSASASRRSATSPRSPRPSSPRSRTSAEVDRGGRETLAAHGLTLKGEELAASHAPRTRRQEARAATPRTARRCTRTLRAR